MPSRLEVGAGGIDTAQNDNSNLQMSLLDNTRRLDIYDQNQTFHSTKEIGDDKDLKLQQDEAQPEGLHYCSICRVYQPLRTKHCQHCERCIRTYDHHCCWIGRYIHIASDIYHYLEGSCVGELNRGRFVLFLIMQTIFGIWSFLIVLITSIITTILSSI